MHQGLELTKVDIPVGIQNGNYSVLVGKCLESKIFMFFHICMYNSPVWKVKYTYTCLNSKVFLFDFFLANLISVALAGSAYFQ